jgi:hypothetical protein
MEKNLEKLTKKELINKICKMSKKNIIKMLMNKNQSGGASETNINKNLEVQSTSEIITEPIVFNPNILQNNNKNKNKNKNIMKNNNIYANVTDYSNDK